MYVVAAAEGCAPIKVAFIYGDRMKFAKKDSSCLHTTQNIQLPHFFQITSCWDLQRIVYHVGTQKNGHHKNARIR